MAVTPMESEAYSSGLTGESGAPGMLRIRRGEQVRWIWPVHLPGWIALGWQVSAKAQGPAAMPQAAPDAPLPEVLTEEASPRGASEVCSVDPAPAKPRRSKRRAEAKPPGAETQATDPQAPVTPGDEPPTGQSDASPADDLLADVLA